MQLETKGLKRLVVDTVVLTIRQLDGCLIGGRNYERHLEINFCNISLLSKKPRQKAK